MSFCERPIGIFDSGVGGLTVYKQLKQDLPKENFIYLGDTARVPYGTKSQEVVLKYALQDSLFLLDQGVKLIVVACNTASAFALNYLQDRLKVPVIGVIESGAKAAVEVSKNNRVGIIGTEGTIRSQAYEMAVHKLSPNIVCHSKATALFVPLIEENIVSESILKPVFDFYLNDFVKNNIDTLILACTHYPLLKDKLNDYFNHKIQLVDSAIVTSLDVQKVLAKQNLSSKNKKQNDCIYVTDAPERVQKVAAYFLEEPHVSISKIDLN